MTPHHPTPKPLGAKPPLSGVANLGLSHQWHGRNLRPRNLNFAGTQASFKLSSKNTCDTISGSKSFSF
jgi:hypothetical protein